MKKMKKKGIILLNIGLILAFIFANVSNVNAAPSMSYSLSGTGSVQKDGTTTITLAVSGNTGSIVSLGGYYSVADTSCFTITKVTKDKASSASTSQFAFMDADGIGDSSFNLVKIELKAGSSACSTTLNVTDATAKFTDKTALKNLTTSKSLTVTEPVAKSSDANLKSLTIAGQTLTPAFNAGTLSYTVSDVPASTTSVSVSAVPNDSKATVSGAGNITLSGDSTTVSIVVTAEDGKTKKTYTVVINKQTSGSETPGGDTPGGNTPGGNTPGGETPGGNTPGGETPGGDTPGGETPGGETPAKADSSLKSLTVDGYNLSPKFKPGTTSYSLTVKSDVTDLNVAGIATDENATVEITGNTGLVEGPNKVTVKVTATDGTTTSYIINVVKEAEKKETDKPTSGGTNTGGTGSTGGTKKSSDASIKSLNILSAHKMEQPFSPNVTSYSITVPYEVTKLDLSYLKGNSKAKINITGNDNFKVGEVNTVTIRVTAEDGTVRYYFLNVTRTSETSKTSLSGINISNGTLSPKFDPDKTSYTVYVDGDQDKLNINAIPVDPNSKVEIIGNAKLKEGHNTVLVKVTDENGMSKYYELDVVKAGESEGTTFLGLKPWIWAAIGGGLLLTGLIVALIILGKKKKDDEEKEPTTKLPNIEFKPEFNFGSKNGTDDDYVAPGGVLNQNSGIPIKEEKTPVIEASYDNSKAVDTSFSEVYDMYDETVTKDELVDAIHEAMNTKDPSKLKMLLDQDELNKRKKEIQNRDRY